MTADSDLQADNAHLRARIHALEAALAAAQQQAQLAQSVLDSIPSVVYSTSVDGELLLVNAALAQSVGVQPQAMLGQHQRAFFPPELVAYWQTQTDQVIATRQPLMTEEESPGLTGTQVFLSQRSPIMDRDGAVYAVAGIATDITALRQAEREREQLQAAVIAAQQVALRELSTPLIPIVDGVVVMPLIGSMDSRRAQQVIETMLDGVGTHHATQVILDITGLPVVDTQVASVLIGAAQAVKLLGVEVLLTGIGPEVAQTLIGIGTDLRAITTPGTLQNGSAYALRGRTLGST